MSAPPHDQGAPALRFERDAPAYVERLYTAALRLTGDREDAAQLVEQTYARAYRLALSHPQDDPDLPLTLFRTLTDIWLRSCTPDRTTVAPTSAPDATWTTPEVESLNNLPHGTLAAALTALPPDLRMTLYFADAEGFTYAQVAAITATPRDMVITRLSHARRHLRTLLTEHSQRVVMTTS
ncbi:MAG: hypothetical protein HOV68_20545 [Streptomycetaceae bacterium]|nr:hypothetical protein [Streptomycetaceae bacterium]